MKDNINQVGFTPSINILRDQQRDIEYLVSPNTKASFTKILNSYEKGTRAFSLIGAYGSGKSSFLWAFQKTLNQQSTYFKLFGSLSKLDGVDSIIIIGNYASFQEAVAIALGLDANVEQNVIFKSLEQRCKNARKNNQGVLFLTDEFGKFLEYAAKEAADAELYFIQLLAEFVCDPQYTMLWINTLHQDFSAYAFGLNRAQQNEWVKVKGRFIEVPFNEPVEQLLFLASERLALKYRVNSSQALKAAAAYNLIKAAKAYPLKDFFNSDIASKLFPLDILSAAVITQALQQYGQNERSLFSFIETNDYLSLEGFQSDHRLYNLANVYDYLKYNYSILRSRHNPHYTKWTAIQSALERAESFFEEQFFNIAVLLKSIGLLNIFTSNGACLDKDFYKSYLHVTAGIEDGELLLELLEQKKIIRYHRYNNRYVLFEGTDLDIDLAIEHAGSQISANLNLLEELKPYLNLPLELAKAAFFESGTPRFFEYKLTEEPLLAYNGSLELDGCINLIFNKKLTKKKLLAKSKESRDEPILYGLFRKTDTINELLLEIAKIKHVLLSQQEDKVARKELELLIEECKKQLNNLLLGALFSGPKEVLWVYRGKELTFVNKRSLNKQLSIISNNVYFGTPSYKNEMINKSKLSSSMIRAQKNLVRAYTLNRKDINLGFEPHRTPPEKTIYLSLLRSTGLMVWNGTQHLFQKPKDESFTQLWDASEEFLESSKAGGRTVFEYKEFLSRRPFKLKDGFLQFWIPIFLYAKRNEFALFDQETYIPVLTSEVLEVLIKNPKRYNIKAFRVNGPKLELFQRYRTLIGKKQPQNLSNQSFIDTVKPFLIFYKGLPTYTKNTKRLSLEGQAIRKAIAEAKDPEKVFFEDFPSALGFNANTLKSDAELNLYIERLQEAIKELRQAYEYLLNRFESYILTFLGKKENIYKEYKNGLNNRFKAVQLSLLNPKHKVFLQRLRSDLDRDDWLNSIAQACIGTTLEKLKDRDEPKLYDKFKEMILELDNLSELSKIQDSLEEDEELFALELHSLGMSSKRKTIRYPKAKAKEISAHKKEMKKFLSKNDKIINIAVLTQILNELLENG